MEIFAVTGKAIMPYLPAVARLRIEVFREFPYLYDGDPAYEEEYLSTYADASHSLLVVAVEGDEVVGASTAIPLGEAEPVFQEPLLSRGFALDQVCYFGESVLLAAWRGKGIGHRFFDERERYAQSLGATLTTFCAVERPDDHPRKPFGYRPLHAFWQARGYARQPDCQVQYGWKDVDQPAETDKTMVFWWRSWDV